MPYAGAVDIVEKAFGQRQIMNSVENIGFPDTVVSHYAVYPRGESYVGLAVVFEVGKEEFLKVHFNARCSG